MIDQDLKTRINDAKKIAEELQYLLHEDSLHRLRLYQEYSSDTDSGKWTPDLYLRWRQRRRRRVPCQKSN